MTELDLIKDWKKTKNKQSLQKLLDIYSKHIDHWCFKFSSNTEFRKDLYNEAVIGIISALDRYDFTKENKPLTYIMWYIKQAIKDYIISNKFLVSIAKDKTNFKLLNQYSSLIDAITHKNLKEMCEKHNINQKNAEAFVMWVSAPTETNLNSEDVSEQYCTIKKTLEILKSFTEYQKECFFYVSIRDLDLDNICRKWQKSKSAVLLQGNRILKKVQEAMCL